jgi:hypothetical protein
MCNFVVPIRTCSKCQQKEPLFDEKERQFTSVGGKKEVLKSSMLRNHPGSSYVLQSESQPTWNLHKTAIRADVSSAANTPALAALAGSLVKKRQWHQTRCLIDNDCRSADTAKHVRFRVAHIHSFATAAHRALRNVPRGSQSVP